MVRFPWLARQVIIPVFMTALAVSPATAQDEATHPEMKLSVDVSDTLHRLMNVRELLRVSSGRLKLNFPEWIQGHHAPANKVNMLAGLVIKAGGRRLDWVRDPTDAYAFLVDVPEGIDEVELRFQVIGAVRRQEGHRFSSDNIVRVDWQMAALYPAGKPMRDISVEAAVRLPAGWQVATALEKRATQADEVGFATVDFETLLDSPMYAARHLAHHLTNAGAAKPVTIAVAAETANAVHIPADQLAAYARAFDQTVRLFGSQPYAHYDFLVTLTGRLSSQGIEHQQSSEDSLPVDMFSDSMASYTQRNLMVHEYVHSWNGKLHRPHGLVVPDANTPLRDDLLWVYEGLTTYLDKVLTVRGGLWTVEDGKDIFAETYADFDHEAGRQWRSLQDTNVQPIIGEAPAWDSWTRGSDYYEEGSLLWLDVDTTIRSLSGGRRSLDDFIRAFLGGGDRDQRVRAYHFEDIVAALNNVQPYDWAAMLRARLDTHEAETPKEGLARGGYRLVYSAIPSAWLERREARTRTIMLDYSLGASLGSDATVKSVRWDSPAYAAGLLPGDKITSVDGQPFSGASIKQAIAATTAGARTIAFGVDGDDGRRTINVTVTGGLRYPHLEPIPNKPRYLDAVLAPR